MSRSTARGLLFDILQASDLPHRGPAVRPLASGILPSARWVPVGGASQRSECCLPALAWEAPASTEGAQDRFTVRSRRSRGDREAVLLSSLRGSRNHGPHQQHHPTTKSKLVTRRLRSGGKR